MIVRPAAPDDAEAVARIYIDSWNEGFGHLLGRRTHAPDRVDRWRDDLADGDVAWVVSERDSEIVGFGGVGPSRDPIDPAMGELHAIAVDPAHWRAGVGAALMGEALVLLRRSWTNAVLWTPLGHERGHAFYEATGWRPIGRARRDGTEVAFGHDL